MVAEINTIDDVKMFAHQLLDEKLNFHPDESFENYIDSKTHLPCYSAEEAQFRNHLMSRCFEVCDDFGVDIYEIMCDIFYERVGFANLAQR